MLLLLGLAACEVGALDPGPAPDPAAPAPLAEPVRTPAVPAGPPPTRVLFVGNSHTRFHDVPDRVRRVCEQLGVPVRTAAIHPNGERMAGHVRNPEVLAAVATPGLSHVVLQENGQVPGHDPDHADAVQSKAAVQDLIARVEAAGAQPVLYQTWGPRSGFQPRQDQLVAGVQHLADGRPIAAAGQAFARLREADPQRRLFRRLYDRDGGHASPLGAELAARVIATTLGCGDARTLPAPDELGPDEAARFIAALAD